MLFSSISYLYYNINDLGKRDRVVVATRSSGVDADTLELSLSLPSIIDGETILAVQSKDEFLETIPEIIKKELRNKPGLRIIGRDSKKFTNELAKSKLVILNEKQFHNHRLMDRSGRTYIKTYHGIITKSYGKYKTNTKSYIQCIKNYIWNKYINNNIKSAIVESDTERFFRSSAEGLHPSKFEKFGYPRYDRINKIKNGEISPLLNDDLKDKLSKKKYNILYAPTHKDGKYQTNLFPFDDFDIDEFMTFLDKNNICMLIRLHPDEEKLVSDGEIYDNDCMVYAGQSVTPASTEILPYTDHLITDYSSIYMDFIPFNKPITYIWNKENKFQNIRGIPFDSDKYFPGPKITTYDQLINNITRCMEGKDEYNNNREFVENSLLSNDRPNAVKKITDEYYFND